MRILTRYILGEITTHAILGCALFTFILFMRPLEQILDMVVRNSSSLTALGEIILFTLPNTFLLTIPMAVLVGVLLGLSRLAADSEIIAMRASGMGIWYLVRVAAIVAGLGTAFGLVNSLYLSPMANRAILTLQNSLAKTQASFEVQPRVFYEDFRNTVVYVQDARSSGGVANWKQMFIADVTNPITPQITTAESATITDDSEQGLLIRLRNASQHAVDPKQPDDYTISTYATTDRPLTFSPQSDVHLGRMDTPLYAEGNRQLLREARAAKGMERRRDLIELNRRLAYPLACLVLMLVGVPLGAASRRGGKSMGFVYTLLLVLAYYLLSNLGIAWGRTGKLPVVVAVWLANALFAAAGVFLLMEMANGGRAMQAARRWLGEIAEKVADALPAAAADAHEANGASAGATAHGVDRRMRWLIRLRLKSRRMRSQISHTFPSWKRRGFPLILDQYVLREFLKMFGMILFGFVLMMLIFTFFELVADILRNHVALYVVGDYLVHLAPSMIYQITPLSVLIAVLVTFSILHRNSELTAMKATGVSLYRLVLPVFAIAAVLAVSLFAFDQSYLPQANREQEALRNTIKGRPPQTTLHPDQKWIVGNAHGNGEASIFYYQFFDPDQNAFANLTLFEFDAKTFALKRRIFAERVLWDDDTHGWVFENGWERSFDGASQTAFRSFLKASFPEVTEPPAYFKKENLQSQEMNFAQLGRYIHDLQRSGFDTMRLRVELYHKIAYPLVTIVMAVLAVPFALSMGKRGSLTGVATAIAIAVGYWVVAGLFDAMGSVNYLPASLAAWSPDILFALTGGYLLLRTPT